MLVVCDIETDNLEPDYTKIWVVVCKEIDSGKTVYFTDRDKFAEYARSVTGWIGHNFLGFDRRALHTLWNIHIDYSRVIDTLVVSRLLNYSIEGGHSLDAWGRRLNKPKMDFKTFDKYSPEMLEYCINDVEVNYQLYLHFKRFIYSSQWQSALRTEHDAAQLLLGIKDNGFKIDVDKAKELRYTISSRLEVLDKGILSSFKPKVKFLREISPSLTKSGTLKLKDFQWYLKDNNLWYAPVSKGNSCFLSKLEQTNSKPLDSFYENANFSLIEYVPFNPASPSQMVQRLNEAGWKPVEKTKTRIQAERNRDFARVKRFEEEGNGWKVSERNLKTLPPDAPEEAHWLAERLLLASQLSDLDEWLALVADDQRIHGSIIPIGSWTHRCAHQKPNTANIPSDPRFRELWIAEKGAFLVGTDMESAHLRLLAHMMRDRKFIHAMESGVKGTDTDPHIMNAKALGEVCTRHEDFRDRAKTFIYTFLNGGKAAKVGEILGCSIGEGRIALDTFIKAFPGLEKILSEDIPRDAARGYFEGLDGRYVMYDREHGMLAGYLQNGEVIVMKMANKIWHDRLIKEGINFKQVNFVHDEWQTEVYGTREEAEYVGKIQAESITQVGEMLGLECKLAGSYDIGINWSETH